MTPRDAWQAATHQLKLQLDQTSFDTYLRETTFLDYEAGTYRVGVQSGYARDVLQHRLYRNVRRVVSDVAGEDCELVFVVHNGEIDVAQQTEPEDDLPQFKLLIDPPTADDTPAAENDAERDSEADVEPEPQWPSAWRFFAMLPEAVVDALDVAHLGMLAKIMRHMNRKNNVLVRNLDQMAELTEVSTASVKRYTKALVDAGYLVVESGGGRGNANTYRLTGVLSARVNGAKPLAEIAVIGLAEAGESTEPEQASGENEAQNEADKLDQIDPVYKEETPESVEYPINLIQNSAKADQIELESDRKLDQIDPPTKNIKALPENKKITDVPASAGAEHAQPSPAEAVDDTENVIYDKGDIEEKTQPPQRAPQYMILHQWCSAFGEITEFQKAALKDIADRYEAKKIDNVLESVERLHKINPRVDPFAEFQRLLNDKRRKEVAQVVAS